MEDTPLNTYYKYCMVPMCSITSFKTPNKIFIRIPQDKNRRIKWLNACKRNVKDLSEKNTALHVCEDHFNLEEDMENYIRYKLMGGSIRLKRDIVPHIFNCEENRKRAASSPERSTPSMRQKLWLEKEALIWDTKEKKYAHASQFVQTKSVGVQVKPASFHNNKNVGVQTKAPVRSKYVMCKIKHIVRHTSTST